MTTISNFPTDLVLACIKNKMFAFWNYFCLSTREKIRQHVFRKPFFFRLTYFVSFWDHLFTQCIFSLLVLWNTIFFFSLALGCLSWYSVPQLSSINFHFPYQFTSQFTMYIWFFVLSEMFLFWLLSSHCVAWRQSYSVSRTAK